MNTYFIDITVGSTAYSLDKLVFVLRIPTAYVTGQHVRVYRSHRRSNDEKNREGKREELDTWNYAPGRDLIQRDVMRVYVKPDNATGTFNPSGCHTIRRIVAIVHTQQLNRSDIGRGSARDVTGSID